MDLYELEEKYECGRGGLPVRIGIVVNEFLDELLNPVDNLMRNIQGFSEKGLRARIPYNPQDDLLL